MRHLFAFLWAQTDQPAIRYFTLTDPDPEPSFVWFILHTFYLIGIVLAVAFAIGIAFGGFRFWTRQTRPPTKLSTQRRQVGAFGADSLFSCASPRLGVFAFVFRYEAGSTFRMAARLADSDLGVYYSAVACSSRDDVAVVQAGLHAETDALAGL